MGITSYAQCGEDLQLAYLLGKTEGVTYIDVGCLWPVKYSNTFFFYERGGSGLCIDANPEVKAEYLRARPRDVVLSAGIGERAGVLTYYMYKNPGFNTFSGAYVDRLKLQSLERAGRALLTTVEVPMITLDDAVQQTNFAERCNGELDILSIDVEGLEVEVLRGFSFSDFRPIVVVCEHLRRRRDHLPIAENPLVTHMRDKGYRLAADTGHDVYFIDDRRC